MSIPAPIAPIFNATPAADDSKVIKKVKPKTELEMKIIEAQDEHPSKKKDIFKAIFDSDSESDDEDASEPTNGTELKAAVNADVMDSLLKPSTSSLYTPLPDVAFRPKSAREINILRNTSPPRGIFSSLTMKPPPPVEKSPTKDEVPDSYGPSLPPMRASTSKHEYTVPKISQSSVASITLGTNSDYKVVYEEKWIEKSDEKEKKSKKEKKEKKSKKDKERERHKKHKKEKHKKKKR